MRAVSLLYHDVVKPGEFETSGFPGMHRARYKLDYDEFDGHLAAMRNSLTAQPVTVFDVLSSPQRDAALMLTFDDGGISGYTHIMDALDRYGWKGHFFIITNYVGDAAFLNKEHIRALRSRGHVIGSHSSSHPQRMSDQSWKQLLGEWTTSIRSLSDILGEEVTTASVPGGYYSREVAEAASLSGIKALFTSEPVRTSQSVRSCTVFGRYTIRRGMDPGRVAECALGRRFPLYKQFLLWNTMKLAKRVGGTGYLRLRARLLGHAP